jgi:hypothetical protein
LLAFGFLSVVVGAFDLVKTGKKHNILKRHVEVIYNAFTDLRVVPRRGDRPRGLVRFPDGFGAGQRRGIPLFSPAK